MQLLTMDSECRMRGADMTMSTQDIIEADVREAVRRGGLDPLRDRDAVKELVRTAVHRFVSQGDGPGHEAQDHRKGSRHGARQTHRALTSSPDPAIP